MIILAQHAINPPPVQDAVFKKVILENMYLEIKNVHSVGSQKTLNFNQYLQKINSLHYKI